MDRDPAEPHCRSDSEIRICNTAANRTDSSVIQPAARSLINVSPAWRPCNNPEYFFLQKRVDYETQQLRNINSTNITYL